MTPAEFSALGISVSCHFTPITWRDVNDGWEIGDGTER
jgi:hypothetical protein